MPNMIYILITINYTYSYINDIRVAPYNKINNWHDWWQVRTLYFLSWHSSQRNKGLFMITFSFYINLKLWKRRKWLGYETSETLTPTLFLWAKTFQWLSAVFRIKSNRKSSLSSKTCYNMACYFALVTGEILLVRLDHARCTLQKRAYVSNKTVHWFSTIHALT